MHNVCGGFNDGMLMSESARPAWEMSFVALFVFVLLTLNFYLAVPFFMITYLNISSK